MTYSAGTVGFAFVPIVSDASASETISFFHWKIKEAATCKDCGFLSFYFAELRILLFHGLNAHISHDFSFFLTAVFDG